MKTIKKRAFLIVLVIIFSISLCVPAYAANSSDISAKLNGVYMEFSGAEPVLAKGCAYIPVRPVFEAMGATVTYNEHNKQITIEKGGTAVILTIGNSNAAIVSKGVPDTLTLDGPPIIIYDQVPCAYVPYTLVSAFGCNAGYDSYYQVITIDDIKTILASNTETYVIFNQFLTYLSSLSASNQSISGTYTLNVFSKSGDDQLSLDAGGAIAGIAGGTGMETTITFQMDAADYLDQYEAYYGSVSDWERNEILSMGNITIDLILNFETGMIYIRCPELFSMSYYDITDQDEADFSDFWYSSQLYYSEEWFALTQLTSTSDFNEILEYMVSSIDLDSIGYTASDILDSVNPVLGDAAFVATTGGYITGEKYEEYGTLYQYSFTIASDGSTATGGAFYYSIANDYINLSVTATLEGNHLILEYSQMSTYSYYDEEYGYSLVADISLHETDKTSAQEPPAGSIVY